MMLTEKSGFYFAFIAILFCFIKACSIKLEWPLAPVKNKISIFQRKMPKSKNFDFEVFLGLLEARGEGESRARIRCLPVRQSKSDSKMGWVKFLLFGPWLPYHRVSLSLALGVLQGLRISLGPDFLFAKNKGLTVIFGGEKAFYVVSSLNKN